MAASTLRGRRPTPPGLTNRFRRAAVGLCLREPDKIVQTFSFGSLSGGSRIPYLCGEGARLRSAMSSNADFAGSGRSAPRPPPLHEGLRLLLQTTLDAVVVMTAAGTIADWNDRAVDVFGWSRDEVVGRPMADLIIPERYRDAHQNGLKRYLQTGQAVVMGRRIEVSGLRRNGKNSRSNCRSRQSQATATCCSSAACAT